MNICAMIVPLTALCSVVIVGSAAVSSPLQKPAPSAGGTQQPGKSEPAKAVNASMPKVVLAPEHAVLQKMVGNWDANVVCTMPGMEPIKWTATAVYKAVGETWIESDFNGVMDGTPFAGHGVDGYDTNKKKFVSTWVSSMGTEILVLEGTHDAGANSTTMTGECHDPMSGKVIKHRLVTEMKDNDSMTLHMYSPGPDGKEMENMKIEYKRRK